MSWCATELQPYQKPTNKRGGTNDDAYGGVTTKPGILITHSLSSARVFKRVLE